MAEIIKIEDNFSPKVASWALCCITIEHEQWEKDVRMRFYLFQAIIWENQMFEGACHAWQARTVQRSKLWGWCGWSDVDDDDDGVMVTCYIPNTQEK